MNQKLSVVLENFGGKDRVLRYNLNAIAELEGLLDTNLMVDNSFWANMSISGFRAFVWAALYHEDPRPTLLDVGEWISDYGLDKVGEKIAELLSQVAKTTQDTGDEGDTQSDPTQA